MRRSSLPLAVVPLVLCLLVGVASSQEQTNQGTLIIKGRKLIFNQIVAFTGQSQGAERVVVLATGQPIPAAALDKVVAKDAEDNVDSELDQPYLKAVFTSAGELRCLVGRGGNSSFLSRKAPLAGQAVVEKGRVKGEVKLVEEGQFAKEATLVFDASLGLKPAGDAPLAFDPPVKPSVSGKFTGNGKDGKIKYVLVLPHEDFNDKPAFTLLFTERDPATSKRPSLDASFGKLGNALVLAVFRSGDIFGCEVAHSAHEKSPFSSIGSTQISEFEFAKGNVKGRVLTEGEQNTFNQKWEIDLTFAAPLPESMRTSLAQSAKAKTTSTASQASAKERGSTKKKRGASVTDETGDDRSAAPRVAARRIPLPADAQKVQYKQLVQHIEFETPNSVAETVKEFSELLEAQGWKTASGGLVGKRNTSLKRELGDAKLSITVQTIDTGSRVRIFTEGLDWSTPAADDAAKPEPAPKESEEAEAAASLPGIPGLPKQVEEALKKARRKSP